MIFDRFWDDLRRGWGSTLGDFGGSRASPGGVHARCFRPSAPQRIPETDFRRFCLEFWCNFEDFWMIVQAFRIMFTGFSTVFVRMFGETVNEKLKQS